MKFNIIGLALAAILRSSVSFAMEAEESVVKLYDVKRDSVALETSGRTFVFPDTPDDYYLSTKRPGDHIHLHGLSIDGGGIRGLLPAEVMRYIETQTKKPLYKLFSTFGGTSTGGILSIGATARAPGTDHPMMTMDELVNLYETRSAEIFNTQDPTKDYKEIVEDHITGINKSILSISALNLGIAFVMLFSHSTLLAPKFATPIVGITLAGGAGAMAKATYHILASSSCAYFNAELIDFLPSGVLHSKYRPQGLERILEEHLKDSKLSKALRPLVITSMKAGKERAPMIFDSEKARQNQDMDFFMKHVARATSAAPSYFPTAKVFNCENTIRIGEEVGRPKHMWGSAERYTLEEVQERYKEHMYILLDGGVGSNNPAYWVYAKMKKHYQEESDKHLHILSLGTGISEPAGPLWPVAQLYNLTSGDKINLENPHPHDGGQMPWAVPISDVCMGSTSACTDEFLQELLGDNYKRINPALGMYADLDDNEPGLLQKYKKLAEETFPEIDKHLRKIEMHADENHRSQLSSY